MYDNPNHKTYDLTFSKILQQPILILDYYRYWFKDPMKTIDGLDLNEDYLNPTLFGCVLVFLSSFISNLGLGSEAFVFTISMPVAFVITNIIFAWITFFICDFYEKKFTFKQLYVLLIHIGVIYFPLNLIISFFPIENSSSMVFALYILTIAFILKAKKVP